MEVDLEDVEESLQSKFGETDLIDDANIDHYRSNRTEIREEHGGQFVAIIDQEVAMATAPPEEFDVARQFIDELIEEYGREKMESAYITYAPPT